MGWFFVVIIRFYGTKTIIIGHCFTERRDQVARSAASNREFLGPETEQTNAEIARKLGHGGFLPYP